MTTREVMEAREALPGIRAHILRMWPRAGALVLERVMAEVKKQLDAEAFAASLEAYKKIYG